MKSVDGDRLYAVGDVNGLVLLTHMGKYQARLAGEVIAARARPVRLWRVGRSTCRPMSRR